MYIASENNKSIQNGQRDVTVKHTEKCIWQQNGTKNKNDNFTVSNYQGSLVLGY